jgi:fatty acyl-CoA reductase
VAVPADVMAEGLGISPEDEEELVEHVSVVFHAAATVKFDEALKVSVNMNVQGTQRIVALCKKMKNLAVRLRAYGSSLQCLSQNHEIIENQHYQNLEFIRVNQRLKVS